MTKIANFDRLKLPNLILLKYECHRVKSWEFSIHLNMEFSLKIKIQHLQMGKIAVLKLLELPKLPKIWGSQKVKIGN